MHYVTVFLFCSFSSQNPLWAFWWDQNPKCRMKWMKHRPVSGNEWIKNSLVFWTCCWFVPCQWLTGTVQMHPPLSFWVGIITPIAAEFWSQFEYRYITAQLVWTVEIECILLKWKSTLDIPIHSKMGFYLIKILLNFYLIKKLNRKVERDCASGHLANG